MLVQDQPDLAAVELLPVEGVLHGADAICLGRQPARADHGRASGGSLNEATAVRALVQLPVHASSLSARHTCLSFRSSPSWQLPCSRETARVCHEARIV